MTKGQKIALLAAAVLFAVIVTGVILTTHRPRATRTVSFTGAVVRQDIDPMGRTPIADAKITATSGPVTAEFKSDTAGSFHITLHAEKNQEIQDVTLRFQHSDYQPLEVTLPAATQIYVAHMTAVSPEERVESGASQTTISNVRVRYSLKTTTTVDVGSLAKTFAVYNTGGIPCHGQASCSPDGNWKAVTETTSYDAGETNQFRDIRVSCIAGPCPFTRISSEASQENRKLNVTATNWSDTATFLVEAEVTHTMISDMVRESIPVVFDDAMNFTLPATGLGPSVEADLNGAEIVFPLGPDFLLPWATCTVKADEDRSKLFRCELKPGYRFQ